MAYTGGVPNNSESLANQQSVPAPAVPAPASSAIFAPTRTESSRQTAASRNAAIDVIASDSAKVSLAGAMLSQAAAGSDVRFDKVASLRQAIEAGTYNPSAAAVSSKLMDVLKG